MAKSKSCIQDRLCGSKHDGCRSAFSHPDQTHPVGFGCRRYLVDSVILQFKGSRRRKYHDDFPEVFGGLEDRYGAFQYRRTVSLTRRARGKSGF
jgi:hypothetical protein